jgi:single-strand DNA-binding protein
MINEALVTLTGYIATNPVYRTVGDKIPLVSMRVAWTPRRRNRVTGEWADGETSYATVTCWRKVAENVSVCLRKGDPVLVKGRLTIREYDGRDGKPKIAADVDAFTIGHDLSRGVAHFVRTRPGTGKTAAEAAAELAAAQSGEAISEDLADEQLAAETAAEFAAGAQATSPVEPADDEIFDDDAVDALTAEAESEPAAATV